MCNLVCYIVMVGYVSNLYVSAFEHMASRRGQVSMALLGHKVQFGFGCVIGHNMLLQRLPII